MPHAVKLLAWASDIAIGTSGAEFWARLEEVAHEELAFSRETSSGLKKQPLVTLPLLANVVF
jgi:hypothetical protein